MAVIVMDSEDLERMLEKVVEQKLKEHAVQVPTSLPPVLNKTQFMELLDIGANKAQELFNRPGFPVNREFGHPRIPTGLLLKWIDEHTEWVEENAGKTFKARRRAM